MQRSNTEFDRGNLAPERKVEVQVHVGSENEVGFDLEASLNRIANLSESLTSLTRKRPSYISMNAGGSGTASSRQKIRRDPSFGAESLCNSSVGAHSVELDALLHSLDVLEFDIKRNNNNNQSDTLSTGGMSNATSITSWNDAQESQRLSTGCWSHLDVNPWVCHTCTYENEPVFLACEMCGETRPPRSCSTLGGELVLEDPTPDAIAASRVHVLQEQRLLELQTLSTKPAAVPSFTKTTGPRMTTFVFPEVIKPRRTGGGRGSGRGGSIDKNLMGDESSATATTMETLGMSSQLGLSMSQLNFDSSYKNFSRMRVHQESDSDDVSV